jgi:hypothetical protein
VNGKIKAKYLGTHDRVYFPRAGWQEIRRITNSNSLSVSFMFTDGVKRKLEANRLYTVEISAAELKPVSGLVMRQQKDSKRVALCECSALFELKDIGEAFKKIDGRGICQNEATAYYELERGATLHTSDAIYWMPQKWNGEATRARAA